MTLILNGDGSVGPLSSTEVGYLDGVTSAVQTQINTKASSANPTFTGVLSYPTDLSVGGMNIVYNQTFNDNTSRNIHQVQNCAGIMFISTGQTTAIPFFSNGGNGVAYTWTVLDPDTGWNVNWNGTYSFSQSGSGSNTFTVGFAGGSGWTTLQRTSGTVSFSVRIMILGAQG